MSASLEIRITTRCCIAGGGPAGMMLGFLLARAGVDVVVLEKHADFLRDFRGDTIHPSTLELMHELGLLEEFLKRPHSKVYELGGKIGDTAVTLADFRHLPTRCRFVAFMPQWDFLDFLATQGRRYPSFRLMMLAEAVDLLEEGGRVAGVRVQTPDGPAEVHADLVIGADGRGSIVRERAGLVVDNLGAPMDVLWTRVSRLPSDPKAALGHFGAGHIFITLDRGDYWQCAYVIPKGGADAVKAKGLPVFRQSILDMVPWLGTRVEEIASWDDVKLLTVAVDRLRQWYRPGLLCIGDAAHAMSPIGGVGINLAIQDAVAAANILAAPLKANAVSLDHLQAVQQRREWPTRVTQRIQLLVQDRIISRVLASTQKPKPPFVAKLLNAIPLLRRIPARVIGMGVRPEHIRI